MSADGSKSLKGKVVGKAAAFTAAASIALSGGAMAALRSNPNLQHSGPQVEAVVAAASAPAKGSNPLASFLKGGISATISKTAVAPIGSATSLSVWRAAGSFSRRCCPSLPLSPLYPTSSRPV